MNDLNEKLMSQAPEEGSNNATKALQTFPQGVMGLTPDQVKASPEWLSAKAKFDLEFARQRRINSWFDKVFKDEVKAVTIPKDRAVEKAYMELRKSTDVLLARALAFSPTKSAEDGPGLLMLPGLLNELRNAAEDVAAVILDHEQS